MADEADESEDAIEFIDPEYPAQQPVDEQRRAFIVMQMGAGAAEFDGKFVAQNFKAIEEWLKSGEAPSAEKPKPGPKLVKS